MSVSAQRQAERSSRNTLTQCYSSFTDLYCHLSWMCKVVKAVRTRWPSESWMHGLHTVYLAQYRIGVTVTAELSVILTVRPPQGACGLARGSRVAYLGSLCE